MAYVLAIYKTPIDADAFDAYYHATHVPLAKTMPGLRGYDINRGAVTTSPGAAQVHLVAVLHFDSMADIQQALASPAGRATAADLANFATGGVELLMFDTQWV
ncbi:MAG: EthD family reductase [Pseudomonadota bacterium]|nr:EthD family reductase [Pseudomonadota bacterium]